MYFKTFDYDGHRMTQYDSFSRSAQNPDSMRAAKCFTSEEDGLPSAMGAFEGTYDTAAYRSPDTWPFGNCLAYFDGDTDSNRSHGNLLKFDFDFGISRCPRNLGATLPQRDSQFSRLFGNLSACQQTAGGGCPAGRRFSQHVVNTADFPYINVDEASYHDPDAAGDDYLRWFSLWPSVDSPSAISAKGALVQTIFAAYPCWSGYANAPPSFVPSLDDKPDAVCRSVPAPQGAGAAGAAVETERVCVAGAECRFELFARDLAVAADGSTPSTALCVPSEGTAVQDTKPLQIESAAGWDDAQFTLSPAYCSSDTMISCVRDADCGGSGTCSTPGLSGPLADGTVSPSTACAGLPSAEGGALKCIYRQTFNDTDAGKFVVRCFTVREVITANGNQSRPCRSVPLCVKVRVDGRAPQFVAPTPLAADYVEADGTPVTAVGACQNTQLQLQISAVDPDRGGRVRLYVFDESAGGTSFFAPDNSTGAECTAGQAFRAYGAARVGAPVPLPAAPVPVLGGRTTPPADADPRIPPGSVASPYAAGIGYADRANATVTYLLQLPPGETVGDGIMLRPAATCVDPPGAPALASRCGELILNADRKVCAYAYDDSRTRARRWVGPRNPNAAAGARLPPHSDGDAYARHCWWVRLQAPPVFVTDAARGVTPFPAPSGADACPNAVTADGSPIRCFSVIVGVTVRQTFVAQDPNPGDAVNIFVVDDALLGGPPSGLTVGRAECVPRVVNETQPGAFTGGMCSPADLRPVPSACSKATLTVEWRPGPIHAGRTHYVCAAARDDSSLCRGAAPGASALGWFGPQVCVGFTVREAALTWAPASAVVAGQAEQHAYVGCEARFTVAVVAAGAAWAEIVLARGTALPPGAELTAVPPGPKEAAAAADGVASPSSKFSWVPGRGTEGVRYNVCFSAAYRLAAPVVVGEAGAPPSLWAQSGCRALTVQRCRYCVADGGTLASVAKRYSAAGGVGAGGGDPDGWLRLWLHNAAILRSPDVVPATAAAAGVTPTTADEYENAGGAAVLTVGLLYAAQPGDSVSALAARFRTTARGLLSMNPDVAAAGELAPGQDLCIIPCAQGEPIAARAAAAAPAAP